MGQKTIMYILGISCYYHDSAAAIIKDGVLIAAAEEERFSRRKHDATFPKRAVAFCLKKAGISIHDVAYVVFYEKPLVKFERIFLTSIAYVPRSFSFFHESMKEWFFDKLWIKSHIVDALGISTSKILFCEHHVSHVASSFFCSPFQKAAVLSIDAVGEWTTASWGIANGNSISLKEELRFPHSLGLLYSAFTVFTGFAANDGEYKVMGLAPYGTPHYTKAIYSLLHLSPDDGSFAINQDFFSYGYSLKKVYTKKFLDIFGKPNGKPDKVISYYADIAASIQKVTEEIVLKMVKYIHTQTNLSYLCYAGGVALNSVANWKIKTESPFQDVYIQPSAGDAGGALGAALWVYYSVLHKKRNFVMTHTYWGESESNDETKKFLKEENITYTEVKNNNLLVEMVAEYLNKAKVIGWMQGRFEWGPRALGNRSILADPRSKKMKDIVNRKIKFREAFRPFAPVCTVEDATKYFAVGTYANAYPFKFMLYVAPVKKEHQGHLGAITHQDGTARPQFIDKKSNQRYYNLIRHFGSLSGVNVLLNTSFNLKGEPIVNTSKEAFSTFQRSGIDLLVLNNCIVTKKKY